MNARKFAFSTLGQAGMGVAGITRIAAKGGAQAIELRVAEGELLTPATSPARAAEVGDELRDAGINLLSLGSYIPLAADETGVEDSLLHHLELAAAAGAAGVRVFMKAADHTGDRVALAHLHSVLPVAPDGVQVLIETHDTHPAGAHLASLCTQLENSIRDRVRVVWDSVHTWAAGERLAESARILAPWLAYVQIKDATAASPPLPVPIGEGKFPIDELAQALDAIGAQVPVSLEWERTWHPELPPLADALIETRTWAHALHLTGKDTS